MGHHEPLDFGRVRTYSARDRPTKVQQHDFVALTGANPHLDVFLDSLPHVLKADDLRAIVDAVATAKQRSKPVVVAVGGHVIKCGLGPLLIDCMRRGIISAVAMNGGASIHDFEVAMLGRTSEDVAASLATGMFGMVRETGEAMNAAINAGAAAFQGMGCALGQYLIAQQVPWLDLSVLAAGVRCQIPVTVHVTVGGDTIHMHPGADGSAIGATSHSDFRLLTSVLGDLGDGGVYLNIGSAVNLPEVFLKALNLARNLSAAPIEGFTTVNMDMLQQYRPLENVVRRPTERNTGRGYALTGHHEIMVPLLFQLVLARLTASHCHEGD
jgi:hypothetical protein